MVVAHWVAGVAYLSWRCTAGLMGSSLVLSLLFLGAEFYAFAVAVGFGLSHFASQEPLGSSPSPSQDPDSRQDPSFLASSNRAILPPLRLALGELPSVTVVIQRRWDSVEITAQTARSALQLRYPWHRLFVVILDAEEDNKMRRAAAQIPCEYVVCAQQDPLVDALAQTSGEFIFWLQPGHLPEANGLEAMLPYFYDFPTKAPILNSTAFVQATLRTLGRPFPDHPLQQLIPLGSFNSGIAPLLGTGMVMRRAVLESIAYLDVRRPVRLGSQLHRRGWVSHVCSQTEVQGGLLPLRNRRVALLAVLDACVFGLLRGWPQLNPTQWIAYLRLLLWSLSGLPLLGYFGIPLWFLLTGQTPVPAFDGIYLAWVSPYVVLGLVVWGMVYRSYGLQRAWQAERYTGAQFFQSIMAAIQAMREMPPHPDRPSQLTLGSQAMMIVLTLGIVGYRLGKFQDLDQLGIPPLGVGITLVWVLCNLLVLSVRPLDLSRSQTYAPID